MSTPFEIAVIVYAEDRSSENLARLDQALVQATFLVPVRHEAVALEGFVWDIPAICIRRSDGVGVLPVFTNPDNLLSWRQEETKYVELGGRALIEMARKMAEIEEIAVNPSGVPRGVVPRAEFDRLLSL